MRNQSGNDLARGLVDAWRPERTKLLETLAHHGFVSDDQRRATLVGLLEIIKSGDIDSRIHALMVLTSFRSILKSHNDPVVHDSLLGLYRQFFSDSKVEELASSLRSNDTNNDARWERSLLRNLIFALLQLGCGEGRDLAKHTADKFSGTEFQRHLLESLDP